MTDLRSVTVINRNCRARHEDRVHLNLESYSLALYSQWREFLGYINNQCEILRFYCFNLLFPEYLSQEAKEKYVCPVAKLK